MSKNVKNVIILFFCIGSSGWLCAQDNSTPLEIRLKSWEDHQRLKEESPFRDLKWRSVGPEFCGGRIEAIACHPDEPNTIYAGAGSGNLWKTVNNGTTWEPIFENESTFAIGCVTIAPSDPKIVWIGTGEVLMARSSYAGTGVFKSTDAGKTWISISGNLPSEGINVIREDPRNKNILYVGTESGVYVTPDRGNTWHSLCNNLPTTPVHDLVIHPRDHELVIGTHGRSCFVLDVSPIR